MPVSHLELLENDLVCGKVDIQLFVSENVVRASFRRAICQPTTNGVGVGVGALTRVGAGVAVEWGWWWGWGYRVLGGTTAVVTTRITYTRGKGTNAYISMMQAAN